ncbi:patatin-like phospholipase family protein [Microvirga flavescens]|uniref:patatin-like phospholipase family protein n=1 Tax=Microvirga flavescens TaxID=2249811 RepID=UPI000DD6B5F0|nr:patatin-like phospholipase family protein [Microvirga flavescens]
MVATRLKKDHRNAKRPPFECIALLLQGGGALGAYQGGVYEALTEANLHPDWVTGISIGAVNAAIIAGNAPSERVANLRKFWETVSDQPELDPFTETWHSIFQGDTARTAVNQFNAATALLKGVPGFFEPRVPSPWLVPPGSPNATSYYDTSILRSTLESLVDFDRINRDENTRLALGTVNVRTGNFVYFDSHTHNIGPQHVMASGALPPGFPAVEIDGEFFWDGGLVSNTPLQWVTQVSGSRLDTLVFQVDLWNARGEIPRDLGEVAVRQKEIQFSSRTRANTDEFKRLQQLRVALASLLEQLPPELATSDEARLLRPAADRKVYNIVHLIYRSRQYERQFKDYEFSRLSMEEHWRAGYNDAVRTLRHPEIFERPSTHDGVATFDCAQSGVD